MKEIGQGDIPSVPETFAANMVTHYGDCDNGGFLKHAV